MKLSLHFWPSTMLKKHGLGIAVAVGLLCCPGYQRALGETAAPDALRNIDHIIIIYQENWSFDGLYGNFPGANGLANASHPSLDQQDRLTDISLSRELGPDTYNNASRDIPIQNPPQPLNSANQIDTNFPNDLYTLLPFQLISYVDPTYITGDIVHRFWQEQLQINHGANNYFITWSDNPGLVMSHFDATNLPEGLLAQQYTISDKFYHSAFGGSFLNHQFLISAQAPVYPNAGTLNSGAIANLDLHGKLTLNNAGKISHDGSITPIAADVAAGLSASDISFADPHVHYDKNYVVNTTFSVNFAPNFIPFPTGTPPASLLPSLNDTQPNEPNYTPTIGDRLDHAGVIWKWYSGGWNEAVESSPSNPTHYGNPGPDTVDPLFQWHHQAFSYYTRFAPFVSVEEYNNCPQCYPGGLNPYAAARLQEEANFFTDVQDNNLPAVSFIKPIGENNEHPGYASLQQGQDHVAAIVQAVQNQPTLWAHTAIFVTYDEHGGRWDHVRPSPGDIWGPGVRVPCIVISPYVPMGHVDHVRRDTSALLATIEDRFHLAPLNQRDAHAHSYKELFTNLHAVRHPFHYDQKNNRITQDVVLTNLDRTTVDGPIYLLLNDLSSGSRLLNASGETSDKTPYILLNNNHLGPNGSIKVTLEFSLPESGGITYSPFAVQDSGSQ